MSHVLFGSRPLRAMVALVLAVVIAGTSSLAALAAPTAPAPTANPSFTTASEYCADAEERAFLRLINNYRAQYGRAPLRLTKTLAAAANHHSIDSARRNYSSHTLSGGVTWTQNIANHGYTYSTYKGRTSSPAARRRRRPSPGGRTALATTPTCSTPTSRRSGLAAPTAPPPPISGTGPPLSGGTRTPLSPAPPERGTRRRLSGLGTLLHGVGRALDLAADVFSLHDRAARAVLRRIDEEDNGVLRLVLRRALLLVAIILIVALVASVRAAI